MKKKILFSPISYYFNYYLLDFTLYLIGRKESRKDGELGKEEECKKGEESDNPFSCFVKRDGELGG